ncbi:MAG TPA: biotin--[acetyl-CoA-carboxylase] ligase [Candidatus Limnocylindrales bacterium]
MAVPPFFTRSERFAVVGSTNDVVRDWLAAGTAEVCLAVADEQSAGRGREARRWVAPPGAGLLLSLGFRPTWLAPDRAWRLAAAVALAIADAAEEVAGLRDGSVRLKWPNDLVLEERVGPGSLAATRGGTDAPGGRVVRKLGGVLGESDGLGGPDPRVVVGLGLNADWARVDFPAELAGSMTSLREASGGRPIDRDALLEAFLGRLEARVLALRGGAFDVAGWHARQLTTGRTVRLEVAGEAVEALAVGVDGTSGALLVRDPATGGERAVLAGEVTHVRLADPPASLDAAPAGPAVAGSGV